MGEEWLAANMLETSALRRGFELLVLIVDIKSLYGSTHTHYNFIGFNQA